MGIDLDFVIKSYENSKIVKGYLEKNYEHSLSIIELKILDKYLNRNDNILDIGCGVGRVSFGLCSNGFRKVTGIDVSNEMIKEAEKINVLKKMELKFEVQDVLNLNYNDNAFNSAVAMHSITPIPERENRKNALCEIRRVLNNNSIFILSTFLREMREDDFWVREEYNWKNKLQDKRLYEFGDIFGNKDGVEFFIHIPSRDEFIILLEESGFEIIDEFIWTDFANKEDNINSAQKCKYWVTKAIK